MSKDKLNKKATIPPMRKGPKPLSAQHKRPQAGKAFQKVLQNDPKTQEAMRRVQARMKAYSDVIKAVFGQINPSATVVNQVIKSLKLTNLEKKAQAELAEELKKLYAELDLVQEQYEAEWLAETGVAPPQYKSVEELEEVISWWQQQAAFTGIDPNKILEAGELVQTEFEPIIRGKLQLLSLQAACIEAAKPAKDPNKGTVPSDQEMRLADAAIVLKRNRGTITRWANEGKLVDNGKRGKERRVNRSSVMDLKRIIEKNGEVVQLKKEVAFSDSEKETPEDVERKCREAGL